MLRLNGFRASNYVAMVRMALLEKGIGFEFVEETPTREPAFLARSPAGKVPYLETSTGCLSETLVILEYIEETLPGPRFLPPDPYQRAQVRQAMKLMELYIEWPARRLYPGVFFNSVGGSNPELTVSEVKPELRRGIHALARVLRCGDFVMGEQLTLADFVAAFTFSFADRVAKQVYGWDLAADVPGLAATLEKLYARQSFQQINAGVDSGMAERCAVHKASGRFQPVDADTGAGIGGAVLEPQRASKC